MASLEEQIANSHGEIKYYTLGYMRSGVPFRYMRNLSHYGESMYNVPAGLSFEYGLNKCLDYYNANKRHDNDMSTEFYALKKGAEEIIRYCYNNYEFYNNEALR